LSVENEKGNLPIDNQNEAVPTSILSSILSKPQRSKYTNDLRMGEENEKESDDENLSVDNNEDTGVLEHTNHSFVLEIKQKIL